MKKVLAIFIVLFCFLVLGSFSWIYIAHFAKPADQKQTQKILFEVKKGQALQSVAKALQESHIIRNANSFVFFSRVLGFGSKLKAGEYEVSAALTGLQLLEILSSGRSYQRTITIPEGWNVYEIAEVIEKAGLGNAKDFFEYIRDPQVIYSLLGEQRRSLEGYLFPETYSFTKEMSYQEIVRMMVRNSLKAYDELALQFPRPRYLGRHELFTLASIVEKETGAPEERPTIASVFYNRLSKGMRLQTDPTIIYGMAEINGVVPRNISKADILRPSDYNTYVISGLPPGPISNPGKAALLAVFNPAQSPYLFFVSQNDGRHVFTETYADHQQQVQKYQMDPKAREGKSWRQLNERL